MVEMVTSLCLGEVALRYVQRTVREDSGNPVRNLIGMVSVGLCVLCLLSGLRHHRYFTGSDFGVERLTNTIHTNQRKPNQSNSGQQISPSPHAQIASLTSTVWTCSRTTRQHKLPFQPRGNQSYHDRLQ